MTSRLLVLLSLPLVVLACDTNAGAQHGVVEFSIEGTQYRIEDVAMLVRANPNVYDGRAIKTIAADEEHTFGFFLTRPPTVESPEPVVDMHWYIRTRDPQSVVRGPLLTEAAGGEALGIAVLITVEDISLTNEHRADHEAWVAVDEFTNGWAIGRFGGQIQAVRPQPETGVAAQLVEVDGGRFRVPYEELFQFR